MLNTLSQTWFSKNNKIWRLFISIQVVLKRGQCYQNVAVITAQVVLKEKRKQFLFWRLASFDDFEQVGVSRKWADYVNNNFRFGSRDCHHRFAGSKWHEMRLKG